MELGFLSKIDTLNASNMEYFIPLEESGSEVVLSLKNIKFADPYGVIMLIQLIKHLRSRSVNVRIIPPISVDVLNWLERMNFFVEIETAGELPSEGSHFSSNERNPSRSLKEKPTSHPRIRSRQ